MARSFHKPSRLTISSGDEKHGKTVSRNALRIQKDIKDSRVHTCSNRPSEEEGKSEEGVYASVADVCGQEARCIRIVGSTITADTQ